jgi:hypothetical protein
MALPIAAILGAVPAIGKIIDRVLPDQGAKDAAKLELAKLVQNGDLTELETAAKVIIAESKAGGLAANWRPITMLTFVAIIANNYILAPYLEAMFGWNVVLDPPPDLWDVIKIGLGGYVVGRSAEKGIKAWKNPDGA